MIIEYNHIYGNTGSIRDPTNVWDGINVGGAIRDCAGTIRNNIIEGNHANLGSALYNCSGLIENNIIARNFTTGLSWNGDGHGILYQCRGTIRNNTIVENWTRTSSMSSMITIGGGLAGCTGRIYNNIIWASQADQVVEYDACSTPTYCTIKNWTKGGLGNSGKDPHLVQSAFEEPTTFTMPLTTMDWHLRPDSPCIDAGMTTSGLTSDQEGHARGKAWFSQSRGDGSHTDIGAYEFEPKPVTLWLPGDAPHGTAGQALTVNWTLTTEAGPTLALELLRGGAVVQSLGEFTATGDHSTPELAATAQVPLASALATATDYQIRGRSTFASALSDDSAPFSIIHPNAVPTERWSIYE